MMPILEMRKISKRFPGVIALNAVDFSISEGEVVALAGENGAGKSTLMKILGGVYQPDEGQIFINGQETVIRSVTDAGASGIAFIRQKSNELDSLAVAGGLFESDRRQPDLLNKRLKPIAGRKEYLEPLGLNISFDTSVRDLSTAERQMIDIAEALSLKARILIMDEPTSNLTILETERLLTVIKKLRNQRISIIYISHRLGEIKAIADRTVVLRGGKNIGILEREEINHYAIVKMMVGRDNENSYKLPIESSACSAFIVSEGRTGRFPNYPISSLK